MIHAPVRSETFYVAQRAVDRDVVEVFVLRYTYFDGRPLRSEHFGPDGWREHAEGVGPVPAVVIPGILAFLLEQTDPYVDNAAPAVEALIAKVLCGASYAAPVPGSRVL